MEGRVRSAGRQGLGGILEQVTPLLQACWPHLALDVSPNADVPWQSLLCV